MPNLILKSQPALMVAEVLVGQAVTAGTQIMQYRQKMAELQLQRETMFEQATLVRQKMDQALAIAQGNADKLAASYAQAQQQLQVLQDCNSQQIEAAITHRASVQATLMQLIAAGQLDAIAIMSSELESLANELTQLGQERLHLMQQIQQMQQDFGTQMTTTQSQYRPSM